MEELRLIPDIREQAEDIEKMALAFCLDPNRRVNMHQTVTIIRYFKDMRGIMEELLLPNSYLAGRLKQSAGKAKNNESAILSVVTSRCKPASGLAPHGTLEMRTYGGTWEYQRSRK